MPYKIVLTGPESTGKSLLTRQLATHFNGIPVDEFAREYITQLNRPYTYHDVELIARQQVLDMETACEQNARIVFIDTYLIITKVWFEVVFSKTPMWIEDAIRKSHIDLFLLCAPDIPWIQDNVRENGGEMREWLFREYEKNLIKYNFAYKIVNGAGADRLKNAVTHVESFLRSGK